VKERTRTARVGLCHRSNDHRRRASLHEPTACTHGIT